MDRKNKRFMCSVLGNSSGWFGVIEDLYYTKIAEIGPFSTDLIASQEIVKLYQKTYGVEPLYRPIISGMICVKAELNYG